MRAPWPSVWRCTTVRTSSSIAWSVAPFGPDEQAEVVAGRCRRARRRPRSGPPPRHPTPNASTRPRVNSSAASACSSTDTLVLAHVVLRGPRRSRRSAGRCAPRPAPPPPAPPRPRPPLGAAVGGAPSIGPSRRRPPPPPAACRSPASAAAPAPSSRPPPRPAPCRPAPPAPLARLLPRDRVAPGPGSGRRGGRAARPGAPRSPRTRPRPRRRPSSSSAASSASSTVRPVVSTHSIVSTSALPLLLVAPPALLRRPRRLLDPRARRPPGRLAARPPPPPLPLRAAAAAANRPRSPPLAPAPAGAAGRAGCSARLGLPLRRDWSASALGRDRLGVLDARLVGRRPGLVRSRSRRLGRPAAFPPGPCSAEPCRRKMTSCWPSRQRLLTKK